MHVHNNRTVHPNCGGGSAGRFSPGRYRPPQIISSTDPPSYRRLCPCAWPQSDCPRCCMFRSKRTSLVKRLWKLRAPQHESHGAHEKESAEDLEVKSVAQSMLKRLKESQLEMLLQALESKGGETTECVLLPKGELRLGRRTVSPHVLCCQLFRWPGTLKSQSQMKRLPCCGTLVTDPAYVCCNPHHWSLLLDPGQCFNIRLSMDSSLWRRQNLPKMCIVLSVL